MICNETLESTIVIEPNWFLHKMEIDFCFRCFFSQKISCFDSTKPWDSYKKRSCLTTKSGSDIQNPLYYSQRSYFLKVSHKNHRTSIKKTRLTDIHSAYCIDFFQDTKIKWLVSWWKRTSAKKSEPNFYFLEIMIDSVFHNHLLSIHPFSKWVSPV